MPTTIEDRLVVGDRSVVPDLYRQHGAFIHTISQELVGAAADRLTQQVFTEAWCDRLSFNPSLGTVRNWLVRRARARVSKSSPEAEMAVDRLVVADSLQRMEDLRRQVVLAGLDASDADALARQLDQPVATIRANLRRGTDQLKSDLAESRTDGDDDGLVEIMAGGPPSLDLVTPPEVVWQAIAAELDLDTGAMTADDFTRADDPAIGDEVDTTLEAVPDVDEIVAPDEAGPLDDPFDVSPDHHSSEADGESGDGGSGAHSVDQLRAEAEAAELDRSGWMLPAVIAAALVIVIVVVLMSL